ncbi:MAG: diguanylate cyclase, partial [Candidatus Rokubacteria bacterium]|nr:diguanylate cyclase [Candidatus Rokubacteria bacterium]
EYSYFPVKLKDLRSRIHFTELEEGFFRLGDVLVETQYLNHTAPTIAYRLTNANSTIVYVTDHEPYWNPGGPRFDHPGDQRHIAFLKGANLVIHDAQYSDTEYESRIGWGHSPIRYATDIALAAGVQRLALFHHDPTHDDGTMEQLEAETREHVASVNGALDVFAAFEGLELEVKGAGPVWTMAESSAFRRLPIGGRRVLVVSSDADEVAAIEQELSEDSLVMLSVGTAAEVLDRVREIVPDLVILSGTMPEGDPATLVPEIRVAVGRSDFPIVLLTAGGASDDAYREAEPTDYLARPFSPPMLRARVRAWLSRTMISEEPAALVFGRREGETPAPVEVVSQHVESAERYAEMLSTMPLFRPIPPEQLVTMTAGAVDQVYGPGHVVVREGAPASSLYVVVSGRVRVTETARDTHSELLLSELGPGEIFGELGVLRNQPRVASIVALERTHCVILQSDTFITTVECCPPLALGLLQVLAARLSDADRRVARYAPDPLTGLMGRRTFNDQYRRLAAGVRRRRTGALLLMVDVRELRTINDVHGYAAGDEVLKATADALLETTRTTDLVSRYGGDEFAVLLIDVEAKDVEPVVTRLRTRISAAAARHGLPSTIDWTIGAAFSAVPPDPADELLRDADLDLQRRRSRMN